MRELKIMEIILQEDGTLCLGIQPDIMDYYGMNEEVLNQAFKEFASVIHGEMEVE
jgi:hypothetical protein